MSILRDKIDVLKAENAPVDEIKLALAAMLQDNFGLNPFQIRTLLHRLQVQKHSSIEYFLFNVEILSA